jgi:hypothetical protein
VDQPLVDFFADILDRQKEGAFGKPFHEAANWLKHLAPAKSGVFHAAVRRYLIVHFALVCRIELITREYLSDRSAAAHPARES